jgi:hypothetical protein
MIHYVNVYICVSFLTVPPKGAADEDVVVVADTVSARGRETRS